MSTHSFVRSLVVAAALSSTSALAAGVCEGGGIPIQASCGGDSCACAAACEVNEQCFFGCCSNGFCTLACVCEGEGTVTLNCDEGSGCGTVVPTAAPLGGGSFAWGFGLLGLGLIASARFARKGGLRSTGVVASLSLCLLGAAFAAASALETTPVPAVRSQVP